MRAPAPPYVLGVDVGTQSLRAGVFDLRGAPVVFADRPLEVTYPAPGWAEQRPEDWWDALVEAVGRCLADGGIRPHEIVGLSVDGSCSNAPIDAAGNPLGPAILWMDLRAHGEAARVTATGHPALRYAGGEESPEWPLPKAMWLKAHQPKVLDRATYLMESTNWLVFRLTGEPTLPLNSAVCKWHYLTNGSMPNEGEADLTLRPDRARVRRGDGARGRIGDTLPRPVTPSGPGGEVGPASPRWPRDLFAGADAVDVLDKLPARVLRLGEKAGELTSGAAQALGLRAGIAVGQGGIDAYTGMVGLDVVGPGKLALVMGSSTCQLVLADGATFVPGLWGPFPEAVTPGLSAIEGGQASTGSVVRWLVENFGQGEAKRAAEAGEGLYAWLDARAGEVPPGAEGLVVLDYWQGNRTPIRDPLARGVISGLTLKHGFAHLLRAVYEGTAFGNRHILATLREHGVGVARVYACGGGARSKLWLQIHADVAQTPIYLTGVTDAVALGTAICAAVAVGAYPSLAEASRSMVHVATEIAPDPARRDVYDFFYANYLRTYRQLREVMHEVARGV